MILTDLDGNRCDWFKDYIDYGERLNIAPWVSGGADSAFTLFWIAYCISKTNLPYTIYPIHGFDTMRVNVNSFEGAEDIVNEVSSMFPNVNIKETHVFPYCKNTLDKTKYHQPMIDYLARHKKYDITFWSLTRQPGYVDPESLDSSPPMAEMKKRSVLQERPFDPTKFGHQPIQHVDKKFIAHQYQKYGLMDSLYPLTVSCLADQPYPCRNCAWCQEKFWAFGSYDGGI